MKCTFCGCDTSVKETRSVGPYIKRRRHRCFDKPSGEHDFWTVQVPERIYSKRKKDSINYKIKFHTKRAEKLKRNRLIERMSRTMSQRQIAEATGLSQPNVCRILRQLSKKET